MRALLALVLVACGGRFDSPAANDASVNDTVPCADAGACSASTQYCNELFADGGSTFTCTNLPGKCHACDCAAPPKIGFVCACTSDGDQIIVSCNKT
ncbi:MAG TPA: hypothetical protein VGH28_24950 [Polyangiaceae bacterium]